MHKGIYMAASGAIAQAQRLDAVSSNLANVSTTAFKAERTTFEQMFNEEVQAVPQTKVERDMQQGALQKTGSPLDLAIRGDGFFVVETPAGERYTRDGAFRMDPYGTLTNAQGHAVLATSGPVTVPEGKTVEVSADGALMIDGKSYGTMRVVQVERPSELMREDGGLYAAAGNNAVSDGSVEIVSGHLEKSNVNPLKSMTELVTVSRAYEAFHRAIETLRDTERKAATDIAT